MQIESPEQLGAVVKSRQAARVQRLHDQASARSWLRSPRLSLVAVVGGATWLVVAEGMVSRTVIMWGAFVSLVAAAGVAEVLSRRIDAVVELIDIQSEREAGG